MAFSRSMHLGRATRPSANPASELQNMRRFEAFDLWLKIDASTSGLPSETRAGPSSRACLCQSSSSCTMQAVQGSAMTKVRRWRMASECPSGGTDG